MRNIFTFTILGALLAVVRASPTAKYSVDLADSPSCPETSNSAVTLISGDYSYLLSVPADKQKHVVIGAKQELGCVGPIGTKYSQCVSCTSPVMKVKVSPEAGICAFHFPSSRDPKYYSHKDGVANIGTPSQLYDVKCGLSPFDYLANATAESTSTSVARRAEPSDLPLVDGRLCHDYFDDNYEMVRLYSGSQKYFINVYPDDVLRNLDHSQGAVQYGCAQAGPNGEVVFGSSFNCYQCDMTIDKVRFDTYEPGRCHLEFEDGTSRKITPALDDSLATVLEQPARLSQIKCSVDTQLNPDGRPPTPPVRSRRQAKLDTEIREHQLSNRAGPVCDVNAGALVRLLDKDGNLWAVKVHADQKAYTVTGANPEIGCAPSQDQHSCGLCDKKYRAVAVDESAGICYLSFDNEPPIRISSDDGGKDVGEKSLTKVQCGYPVPTGQLGLDGGHAVAARNVDSDAIETSLEAAVAAMDDANCPASTALNAVIVTTDGNTYWAPATSDGLFQLASEMYCIRDADSACVAYNSIGPAAGVSTRAQLGPCNVYTENGQFVKTQDISLPTTGQTWAAVTPINPHVAVSAFECGRGI